MLRVLPTLPPSIVSTAQSLGIAFTEHLHAIVPYWPICPVVNDWLGAPRAPRLMRDRDPVGLIRDNVTTYRPTDQGLQGYRLLWFG